MWSSLARVPRWCFSDRLAACMMEGGHAVKSKMDLIPEIL